MTQLEAKEVTLIVWRELAKNPEITDKGDLPRNIYALIKNETHECALCTLFYDGNEEDELESNISDEGSTYSRSCPKCPLAKAGQNCMSYKSAYKQWLYLSNGDSLRQAGAQKIVNIVKAWIPEE